MRMRVRRQLPRTVAPRIVHRRQSRRRFTVPDATAEPDAASLPEAVLDRVTGPYLHRAALAFPALYESDEGT
jgi:hypothetical protein